MVNTAGVSENGSAVWQTGMDQQRFGSNYAACVWVPIARFERSALRLATSFLCIGTGDFAGCFGSFKPDCWRPFGIHLQFTENDAASNVPMLLHARLV
jgi:hypothetical protein